MRFIAFSAAIVFGISGCGGGPGDMPEVGAVTGIVTIDGKPTGNLTVAFQPEGGRPASGVTDAEGRYELVYSADVKGTKVGPNLVTISSNIGSDENYESGDQQTEKEDPIPAKYNSMATENSEMTVDVKPGANEINWDIKTDS